MKTACERGLPFRDHADQITQALDEWQVPVLGIIPGRPIMRGRGQDPVMSRLIARMDVPGEVIDPDRSGVTLQHVKL